MKKLLIALAMVGLMASPVIAKEKPKDTKITKQELNNLKQYLKKLGVKDSDLDMAVGSEATTADKKSRKEVSDQLKAWCRSLPKAK